MASYNKIQLTGQLNDTPESKVTTSGHAICKFTLVVPRVESLPNERFDYIQVTAWRDNAEAAASYTKGDIVFVEGRVLTDSYEDKNTGQRKWTTGVDAKQVVNLNQVFKLNTPSSNTQQIPDAVNDAFDAAPIENIPFTPVNEAEFFKEPAASSQESDAEPEAEPATEPVAALQELETAPEAQPLEQKSNVENELEEDVPF